jgi:hypothetical protein
MKKRKKSVALTKNLPRLLGHPVRSPVATPTDPSRIRHHNRVHKKTPWHVVCKRTIPTGWPPLVGEVSANFSGQRVSRGQRNGSPRPLISDFQTRHAISLKYLNYPHEAEWNPFQTHYFSENLVAPGIETGSSGSVPRNSDH